MAFFESFSKKFTITPNRFFDEILLAKGTTFNEVKLVGFLIRNTIGSIDNKTTWTGVSRDLFVKEANISYGSINETIKSCVNKGWVLDYRVGQNKKNKEDRYLFLSTEQNIRIVYGLEKGYFTVKDLEEKNDIGIEKLLTKHGIPKEPFLEDELEDTPAPSEEQPKEGNVPESKISDESPTKNENDCSCSNFEHQNDCSCSEIEHVSCSEIEHQNVPSALESQGFSEPYNTSFKNKNNNVDNNVVVFYQNEFKKLFGEDLLVEDVRFFVKRTKQNEKDLVDYMHYVKSQSEKRDIGNTAGYLRQAVVGNWNVPSLAEMQQAATQEAEQKAEIKQTYEEKIRRALQKNIKDPERISL